MPGKNVEDQLRAVNHALVEDAFDIALLRRRKIVVEQDEIGIHRRDPALDLLQLAAADEGRCIRPVAPLQHLADHHCAGAAGQRAQLLQRFVRAELGNPGALRARAHPGGGVTRGLRSRTQAALARLSPSRAHIHTHQEGAFAPIPRRARTRDLLAADRAAHRILPSLGARISRGQRERRLAFGP